MIRTTHSNIGDLKMAKMLVSAIAHTHGAAVATAELTRGDVQGQSPLGFAVFKGQIEVVEWLLYDRGVPVTPADWPKYRRQVVDELLARPGLGGQAGDTEIALAAQRSPVALQRRLADD